VLTAGSWVQIPGGEPDSGSQEIQNPPIVGTTVKSRCQTWFGRFATTVLGFEGRLDLGTGLGAGFNMRRTVVAPR
jgi:hypothetical protein